jgi:hypothetical protein
MKRFFVLIAVVALCACAGNNPPKVTPDAAKRVACEAYNDIKPFVPELRALASIDPKAAEIFTAIDAIVGTFDPNHDLDKLVTAACNGDASAQDAWDKLRPLIVKLALYRSHILGGKPASGGVL